MNQVQPELEGKKRMSTLKFGDPESIAMKQEALRVLILKACKGEFPDGEIWDLVDDLIDMHHDGDFNRNSLKSAIGQWLFKHFERKAE